MTSRIGVCQQYTFRAANLQKVVLNAKQAKVSINKIKQDFTNLHNEHPGKLKYYIEYIEYNIVQSILKNIVNSVL